jgi:hypothetical protein
VEAHGVVRRRECQIFFWQSALWWRWGQPCVPSELYPPGRFLLLISVRGWVNCSAILRLEGLGKLKKKISDLIRDRNCDLPACSIVPSVSKRVLLCIVSAGHFLVYMIALLYFMSKLRIFPKLCKFLNNVRLCSHKFEFVMWQKPITGLSMVT